MIRSRFQCCLFNNVAFTCISAW